MPLCIIGEGGEMPLYIIGERWRDASVYYR